MKYYLQVLIAVFIFSTVTKAQVASPSVSNKQDKSELKTEKKRETEKGKRKDIARGEENDRIEARPKYKRTFKSRTRAKQESEAGAATTRAKGNRRPSK